MTQWRADPIAVWLLALALSVGTFALRLSFIQLHTWLDEFPPRVEQAMGFIPAAILAALVFPELFTTDGSMVGLFVDARVLAGGLAAVVAWRTGSMLATIAVGMGVIWGVQFLFA